MTLLWDTRPGRTFVTPVSPFSFRNAAALLHEHTTNWRKFFLPWNERESVINHLLFSLSNNRPSSLESQKTIITLLASPQPTRLVLQPLEEVVFQQFVSSVHQRNEGAGDDCKPSLTANHISAIDISTFFSFFFNFWHGRVGENPSTPLERAPLNQHKLAPYLRNVCKFS